MQVNVTSAKVDLIQMSLYHLTKPEFNKLKMVWISSLTSYSMAEAQVQLGELGRMCTVPVSTLLPGTPGLSSPKWHQTSEVTRQELAKGPGARGGSMLASIYET